MTEKSRVGILENAPKWWPHFEAPEFSELDQLEIERYCRKIYENVTEEKAAMTPWERWKATASAEIPDRPLVHVLADPCCASRVLDGFSYSLKPGWDIFSYPKLFLKANFGQQAKFKFDFPCPYTMSYATAAVEWGGNAKVRMMPTMAPTLIEGAMKPDEAELANIHIPDPYRDGFFPPTIWNTRKTKEFMKKYDLTSIMPLMEFVEYAPQSPDILMGMRNGLATMKRNPELVHKIAAMETKFMIDYMKAIREAGADITIGTGELAAFGVEKGKPFNKYFKEVADAIGPNNLWCDSALGEVDLEYRCETGSYGAYTSNGWYTTPDFPFDRQRRMADQYKKTFMCLIGTPPVLAPNRTPTEAAETTKRLIKACAGTGFFPGYNQDYFTSPENLETYVKTAKSYGKELYAELKK